MRCHGGHVERRQSGSDPAPAPGGALVNVQAPALCSCINPVRGRDHGIVVHIELARGVREGFPVAMTGEPENPGAVGADEPVVIDGNDRRDPVMAEAGIGRGVIGEDSPVIENGKPAQRPGQ